MEDLTKDEVAERGKEKALTIIHQALELAGLNPKEYDLNLKKKGNPKAAPNIQVYQTAAYLASTCLTASANQIFLFMLSQSEFENYVGIDQKTISEHTGIKIRTVNAAIKELNENGVILKTPHPSDKRRNDYFLNPMSAWKGKTLNRKIALAKLNQFHNPDQLHLFGESFEENKVREDQEIKAKKPNLFLTGGKS